MAIDKAAAARNYRSWGSRVAFGDWTIDRVLRAVTRLELGQFQQAALLVDAMGRDDRITSALDTIVNGVLRLPFKLKAANDTEEAVACRTALWLVWPRVLLGGKLYDALVWLLMIGFALIEIDWNTDDPEAWSIDRIHVWHPQFISWREDLRVFVLQTTDGEVHVDPEDLGGKFIFLSSGGERPWMRGAVRSLGDDFVAHDEAWLDWRRHSEVHGGGIMKAKTPAGVGDSEDKNSFLDSVANVGSDPVVECPTDESGRGYDLGLLETGRDHAAGFALFMDRVVANVNIRLLGQNASTENAGPYVAKGGLFAKVTLDRIDFVVTALEEALHEHLCVPFAELNRGDASLAPVADYDSEPPQDKQAQAQTMQTVTAAIVAAASAGFDVDETEIRDRFGFTLRRKATQAEPAEGAAA